MSCMGTETPVVDRVFAAVSVAEQLNGRIVNIDGTLANNILPTSDPHQPLYLLYLHVHVHLHLHLHLHQHLHLHLHLCGGRFQFVLPTVSSGSAKPVETDGPGY